MNKKIKIFMMLIITTMLLSISIATAINTIETKKQKGESPLYKIRANKAIRGKIQNIKAKFFADRLFFLPFQFIKNKYNPEQDTRLDTAIKGICTFNDGGATCNGRYTCFGSPTCSIIRTCYACTQGINCDE